MKDFPVLSAERNLLETFNLLTKTVNSYGYDLPSELATDPACLSEIPSETIDRITKNLVDYVKLIQTPLPGLDSRELALSHFELYMRIAGVKLACPELMNHFVEGDICEAYATDHQQIFRTLDFFRYCSYDLFTLTLKPWNMLFERPNSVGLELLTIANKIVRDSIPAFFLPVPPHIIQECYGAHRQAYLYTGKVGGCLLDAVTNEPRGYVVILNVQKVDSPTQLAMVN